MPEKNFLLPIEWEVVNILAHEQVGGQSADKRGGRDGCDDGRKLAISSPMRSKTSGSAATRSGMIAVVSTG